MNFYIKNDGFCVKNGDSNANVKAKTSWSTAICNINADIFDLFDWKWRKNGELRWPAEWSGQFSMEESWIRIAKCWFRIAKCWFYNKTGFIGKGMGAPGSSANLIPLCTEKTIDKVRQHDEFCIWKRGFVYLATRTFASKRWILYSNRWILQLQGAKHDEICI